MTIDYLITGGKIVDGTGSPWRYADMAVSTGKIVAIGKGFSTHPAQNDIDATGMVVCPGFIDTHSHVDITLLADVDMQYRLQQGITTEVIGQDGLSYAPASGRYLQEWRQYLIGLNGDFPDRISWDWSSTGELLHKYEGKASNTVHLIPHGAVRVEVLGWEPRAATATELSQMQFLVRKSIAEGAAGISTGLTYIPCAHADTAEMIAICKPVGEAGGILSIHLRSYAHELLAAIEEAIEIGRQSGVAIHISHLRMADVSTWGLAGQVLDLIDTARSAGVDVTFDIYPYTVGCAPLFCLLPLWAQAGGPQAILDRLNDSVKIEKIVSELQGWSIDWSNYALSNAPEISSGDWEGWSLTAAAESAGMDVFTFMVTTLRETELNATIIAEGGSETDNLEMLAHPTAMIGSDGVMLGGQPHPRGFGTYPRLLEKYIGQDHPLSLEVAIHKMTALPASRLNLQNRGILVEGAAADIVIFSLDKIQDNATFENARQLPDGIDTVLVNGQAVVVDGRYLGSSYGQVLKPLQ